MSALVNVLLFLAFVVVPVGAICVQLIPLRLSDVRFGDTDAAHAWFLIAQYAEGTFEQRFGYPTGYFSLDEKKSAQPSKIVLKEAQPAGAVTDGCAVTMGALSVSGFDDGFVPGCITLIAGGLIAAPFILISVLDRFYRFLLRSRVTVTVTASGPDSVAEFAFYGLGAYSLRKRYAAVFGPPQLPESLWPPAPAPAGGPGAA